MSAAFFHDEYQTSVRFKWRAHHVITVWFMPQKDHLNEWRALKAGKPEIFHADTEEQAERKCAEYFNIQHWKDIPKS